MNSLSVYNLTKSYKTRKVVDDVSVQLQTGEIIGLLGPNGAGKTTYFYMILGLIPSNSGKIYLNDINITTKPIHVRAKMGMGYLPQEPSVFRKLTVEDNILAILETRIDLAAAERIEILDALLQEFNLDHIRHIQGISLSGGERRRLEIARTLATKPKFILLDEPFAGVDPISITDIKQIITYLTKKNIGIIITDHNVRETLDICDRAYIMNNGKLIAQGTATEILAHDEVRKVYLGDQFRM
jgi:lipopolysaccharide export system ATP-binding protein